MAGKSGGTGSEKVSEGATKAQCDWKELMERYDALTKQVPSAAKPGLVLMDSKRAEHLFTQASRASREEAVHRVTKRRESFESAGDSTPPVEGESSSDPSPEDKAARTVGRGLELLQEVLGIRVSLSWMDLCRL